MRIVPIKKESDRSYKTYWLLELNKGESERLKKCKSCGKELCLKSPNGSYFLCKKDKKLICEHCLSKYGCSCMKLFGTEEGEHFKINTVEVI